MFLQYVCINFVTLKTEYTMIDLKEELRYVNKDKIDEMSELTLEDKDLLADLVAVSLGNEEYISQHAALIIKEIGINRPEDVENFLDDIIAALLEMENDSQLGSFIEMFSLTTINVNQLKDFLINIIQDETRQAFLKIYCLKLLENYATIDAGRTNEVIELIDGNFNYYNTYYVKKNAKEILRKLRGEEPEETKSVFC